MAEVAEVYYVNAAQALSKGVSGSDGLKATTICVIEDSDGEVHVSSVTTRDTTDDGERQAAAFAATAPLVPAAPPSEEPDPQPEPVAEVVEAAPPAPEPPVEAEATPAPTAK